MEVYDVSGKRIDWGGEFDEGIAQLAGYEVSMQSGSRYFLRRLGR